MQRYIIVTGLPASGKSTIGRAVAAVLGLPMLDKDEIMEGLFAIKGIGNAQWRTRLSRAADEALKERSMRTYGAVIASWWRHPASDINTGTPAEWLSSLSGGLIELHCICPAKVAAERFLSRKRHEGHLDHLKTHDQVLESFQKFATFGPLGIGRLVEVDTENDVELNSVLSEINLALCGGSQSVP
jgi:predicted kinase